MLEQYYKSVVINRFLNLSVLVIFPHHIYFFTKLVFDSVFLSLCVCLCVCLIFLPTSIISIAVVEVQCAHEPLLLLEGH